jgi:murein L,D-transpeptidase YafK
MKILAAIITTLTVRCLYFFMMLTCATQLLAQPGTALGSGPSAPYLSFVDYQRSFPRPQEAMLRKLDTLKKQFYTKKLTWPAQAIYIRSFKYDSQLEVWVKEPGASTFSLFKTYAVCALAGSLGPKRVQGDYQVPEGFYYINEFNPFSSYYLSLGLNYPNASDRILSDSLKPGGDIYIHGSCVTVGCIPITDQQIDELYILAAYARDAGQDFIPVHIFPCRFDVPKSQEYLNELCKDDPVLKTFSEKLAGAYFYFQRTKRLPVVMVTEDGAYHVNDAVENSSTKPTALSASIPNKEMKAAPVKFLPSNRVRTVARVVEMVDQWPQYPGGTAALNNFLEDAGHALQTTFPAGFKKSNVTVEFIVDRDGTPVNFKIIRGLADFPVVQTKLIEQLEKMPSWKPALLNNNPVAKKIVQLVTLQAP